MTFVTIGLSSLNSVAQQDGLDLFGIFEKIIRSFPFGRW